MKTPKPVQAAPTPKVRSSPWRRSMGRVLPVARPLSTPPALKKRLAKAISVQNALKRL